MVREEVTRDPGPADMAHVDIDYDLYPRINKGGGANPAGVSWVPAPPDLVYAL